MITRLLIIGLGGFLGAIARYGTSGLVHQILRKPWFPYGTLAVNLLGCLLIGFLTELAAQRHLFTPEVRLLVLIGFLGSFTTFSTFGYESFNLLRDGEFGTALINVAANVLFGLIAVWLGYLVAKLI